MFNIQVNPPKSFNCFLTEDRKLLVQHPVYSEEIWELSPYTNIAEDLNKFYSIFPNGNPKGTWEFIQVCLVKFY